MPRLAAFLFDQTHAFDAHSPIDGFAHVVDGQQTDGNRCQRFHLDTGAPKAFGGDRAVDGAVGVVDGEFGGDAGQTDRMAQRDQVAGALGRLNRGNAGDTENIAFLGRAVANQGQRFRLHADGTGGTGDTGGFRFVADIHHVGLAGGVEMGQGGIGHDDLLSVTKRRLDRRAGWNIIAPMAFSRRLAALLLASLLAASSVSAHELPELGDVAAEDLPIGAEKRIGQQIMHEIRWREAAYLDDPDVEFYLNQLGNRLASFSADPGFGFQFFAIADPSINAFAMPGGYIGVHTGLILAAQSESELAGVLAHEISHVTQRHIARQIYQSKKVSIASMVAMGLALLAARSNGQVATAAIATSQAGALSAQLAFSRDYEREADRLGFDTLSKAGFDERGMAQFFERLQQSARLYESSATAYLRTHPLSGERMSDMQNRERALPYRQIADSLDFQLVRARLRANQGLPAEAIKDFSQLLQARKFSNEVVVRYGLAQAFFRARDWAAAAREIDAARAMHQPSAMLERLAAQIRLANGQGVEALRIYREAMQRYPQNIALIYGYGDALGELRRYDETLRFAEEQLLANPQDVRLHKLRALAYAGQGRQAMQHRALAEVFALQGQTQGAIGQLELAQKAGDANFYEMSSIDARLRELKLQRVEEMKAQRN